MSLLNENIIEHNQIPLYSIGVRVWGHSGINEINMDDLRRIHDIILTRTGLESHWASLYHIFKEVLELRSGIHFYGMDVYYIKPRIIMKKQAIIMPAGLYIKCFTSGICPALIVYGCNDWGNDCNDLPIHYRGELDEVSGEILIKESTIEDLAGPIKYPVEYIHDEWSSLEHKSYITKALI